MDRSVQVEDRQHPGQQQKRAVRLDNGRTADGKEERVRDQPGAAERDREQPLYLPRPDELEQFQPECDRVTGGKTEAGDAFQGDNLAAGQTYSTSPKRKRGTRVSSLACASGWLVIA